MLKFKIREVLDASGIEFPEKWLIVCCGFTKEKAGQILRHREDEVDMSDLIPICKNLKCTFNDLLYWKDEGGKILPATHPCKTEMTPPSPKSRLYYIIKNAPKYRRRRITSHKPDSIKPEKLN